jgi:ketosteroid isomerase-like protein
MKMLTGWLCAGSAVVAGLVSFPASAAIADEAQIRDLESRFAAAVAARDVDAIMKAYSADVFVFDLTPPRQYVGAAAYRDDWRAFVAGFNGPIQFTLSDVVVTAQGDVAYGHSIQHITGVDPKGGKVDMTVRVSDVYRKSGGTWQIVQEHVSVPIDLATGKPDMTSKP